jgi:hypothetical protein
VNLADVIQVSRPPSSSQSPDRVAGSYVPIRKLGTFSSVIDGLVAGGESSLLAEFLQGMPSDHTAWDGSLAPSTPKGEDKKNQDTKSVGTKNGETSAGSTKKSEPKPKAGLVQTVGTPQVVIQPPILFRALTWENHSQDAETSPVESQPDITPQAHPDAAASPIFTASPPPATPFPTGNDSTPPAGVVFGLRLTPNNPEASHAVGASSQASRMDRELEIKTNTDIGSTEATRRSPQALTAGDTDQNPATADGSTPTNRNARAAEQSPPSRLAGPAPAKMTDPNAFRASGNAAAGDSRRPAEMGWGQGDHPAPMEKLEPANGPVGVSAESSGKPIEASGAIGQDATQNSDGNSQSRSGRIAQIADSPIFPDDEKLRSVPKNSAAGPPPDRRESTATTSLTSWQQSLALESRDQEPLPVPLQPEIVGKSKGDRPPGNAGSVEQGAQATPASGGPEESGPRSVSDALNAIQSQSAKPQITISQATTSQRPATTQPITSQWPPSQTSAAQTAASRVAESQTNSTGETSRGAAPQQTPMQTMANPWATNHAVANQTAVSQISSQSVSHSTPSQSNASQSTKSANDVETSPGPQPQPARQISLKLVGEDSAKVSVDLSERGGKVQIAVRSADPELARSLRTDLGDLVGRLESKGFKTEAWVPTTSRHTLATAAEQSDSRNRPDYPRDTGSGTNQRQGRQGQNGSNQRQQARWMAQLEETIALDETRTENK